MTSAWNQAAATAVALASVLALILLLARVWRGLKPAMPGGRSQGALAIRAAIAIDSRRRLHLIEIDGASALLLTGGSSDVLIPWGTAAGHPGPGTAP